MPAHFGLDIGSHSVKIAELEFSRDHYTLASAGQAPTPPRALISESPDDFSALAGVITQLHKDAGIETRKVVASLPESQIFTRIVEMPALTENELASAIKYEAEQYIPIPLSEVRLDYQVLSSSKEKRDKSEVLLVAAPLTLVDKFMKVLRLAELDPVALETENLATARTIFQAGYGEITLVISLGHNTTDIFIIDHSLVIFTRSIATGGAALARAVAQELGFQLDQAEEYKRAYGLNENQMEGKVVTAIRPVFDLVIEEIRKAIAFFTNKQPNKSIKNTVLTGGTAKLPGITSYLSNSLGMGVEIINPWRNIGISAGAKLISQPAHQSVQDYLVAESPTYAVAVGLALRDNG